MRLLLLLPLFLFFVIGCNSTPPELIGMAPVTITVLDDGKPVHEVRVSLSNPEADTGVWSCNAVTDPSGVAIIT